MSNKDGKMSKRLKKCPPKMSKNVLNVHKMSKSMLTYYMDGPKIKNIDCPQDGCDVKFYAKSAMQVHFRREHSSDPKPYKCELCEKSYSNRFRLKIHKESIHDGIKAPCEFCGKVYSCPRALKNHKVKHHGLAKKAKLKFDDV